MDTIFAAGQQLLKMALTGRLQINSEALCQCARDLHGDSP